ncbi:hypothetical protein GOBAR_DD33036 [Gossypium barbadense]|nr:hypothetical protein GOBAR_DD33036 [Gossypium barbadense]
MFLEYASEGSLLDLMNKYGGKIPERDVNCYTQMILEGLLDIADFGLAKQQGAKDTRSGFRGTKYYMSPESIVGEDTHDQDDLREKLLRGELPNIPEDMSKLGKSFLRECFTIDPNKRWNASELLCHPDLLLTEHMLPKDHQQSLPCFQQQKVMKSRNIPPPPGFNIPNKV